MYIIVFQALTVPLNDSGFLILLPSSYFCNNGKITNKNNIFLSVFLTILIVRCMCLCLYRFWVQCRRVSAGNICVSRVSSHTQR